MPEGCYGTIKDLEGVHYEISKEDEKLYQEYVQKMNFNKMKIGVRARSDVLWPLGMRLEMEVTLTREGDGRTGEMPWKFTVEKLGEKGRRGGGGWKYVSLPDGSSRPLDEIKKMYVRREIPRRRHKIVP
ncbi:hypothetical protein POTOM_053289 [Populus tomentosa]|uniref:Uncharacterized protein n=1 Tax=Populus tomentosa TaxID=118781 RepID=A0A8X7XX75_POPTO|nr:hypothetical protein POTOM_053289 [Populus tomentosa]